MDDLNFIPNFGPVCLFFTKGQTFSFSVDYPVFDIEIGKRPDIEKRFGINKETYILFLDASELRRSENPTQQFFEI
jgi:hypothetical protein